MFTYLTAQFRIYLAWTGCINAFSGFYSVVLCCCVLVCGVMVAYKIEYLLFLDRWQ